MCTQFGYYLFSLVNFAFLVIKELKKFNKLDKLTQ